MRTPAADASPPVPPQAPSAVFRSLPSANFVVRIESAVGRVSAAPSPCASRAPTRTPAVVAKPPTVDEIAMIAIPVTSTRRRPIRSASRPPRSMNPPYVSR